MNKIKELLNHLTIDCEMALDGSWDKSDEGFKAMLNIIAEIESELDKLELAPQPNIQIVTQSKNLWWGYVHTSGTLQAKRYFTTMDTEEAKDSPFCKQVFGPFYAEDRDDALRIIEHQIQHNE